jgi:hypothetical protein
MDRNCDKCKKINLEDVEKLIDTKIKNHEIRVGIISGIIGLFFILGIIHSIWLINIRLFT